MNSYKEFGFEVTKYIDRIFLYEAGSWIFKLYGAGKKMLRKPHLDWSGGDWLESYKYQSNLLWIIGDDDKKIYLPQVVLISPEDSLHKYNSLKVSLIHNDFCPPYKNEESLDFYLNQNSYNDTTARLVDFDNESNELIFQGCKYFDWVATNLSGDFDRSPLQSLREDSIVEGSLKTLSESSLANITGINGLIFTNDGYMVYQKRNKDVLVRPGQLCSGFSGTIDKADIENIVKTGSGVLSDIDTLREAVEEIGIDRNNVINIKFLGLTRELVRCGTPEIFYSTEIDLSKNEVMKLTPKDKEGSVCFVQFGAYAKAINKSKPILQSSTLWQLLKNIQTENKSTISIPFLTNLALWYWFWSKDMIGVDDMTAKNTPSSSLE